MAEKQTPEPSQREDINPIPIEDLQAELRIPAHIHAGICAMMNWKTGKAVSKKGYENALSEFLGEKKGGK